MNANRCAWFVAGFLASIWITPAAADPVKLSIVQVNDVYKMSEEGGRAGMARIAAVVKAERASGKHVLFVHAGDTFSPSLMSGFDKGEHMVALFNELKLDVFVPGNHEFDFGKDIYAKRIGEANFPVFAANLRGPDGKKLDKHQDHTILDIEGVKVGITGAALDETPAISSPGDLRFASTVETVAAQAKAMTAEGADITIAVVHAGFAADWTMQRAHMVDVILSGHDHDLRVEYDGKTAMVESGADGQYVTVIDLTLDKTAKDGKTSFSWKPGFRIIDTADVTPDADMAAKVKVYEDQLSKELDVAVATLDAPLDTRTSSVRAGETAFGDVVADALRAATKADVAITNGGGIRGNREYAAGKPFTRRDVLTELPFGNKTVMVKIKGADILAALENGLGKLPEASGRFPQISGMTVEADLIKPAGARVTKVMIGDKPVDPAAQYTLATNDFMLGGGDGYTMLAKATVLKSAESALLIANDVMAFAKALGHVAAAVEGRIVIKK